ncbi:MAG: type II secretion system protein, partial [Phycisphaerales bacterium]|nr:type II secretion system protein [Phycisphaerales bacterium]
MVFPAGHACCRTRPRGFTIVELLVTVAILAILVGLLLPAISQARTQAKLSRSTTNLRNLGVAHAAYAAMHNDRQLTFVVDAIASYGTSACNAYTHYANQVGGHPNLVLGWGPPLDQPTEPYVLWRYALDGSVHSHECWAGNPITLSGSFTRLFGQFRFGHQTKSFSPFLNGRYYDPVYFAPKDAFLYDIVKEGFESPAEFPMIEADDGTEGSVLFTSSYCLSPAAMYNPDAFAYDPDTDATYTEPWSMPAGLRCPSASQTLYPSLKTHMLEHAWLQNTNGPPCNPTFTGLGALAGCEPYYFNHAWQSEPVTLFYDGHVEPVGVRACMQADGRHREQTGYGLWSRDTPLGENGYLIDAGYDQAATSFHILTVDGIRGRDVV